MVDGSNAIDVCGGNGEFRRSIKFKGNNLSAITVNATGMCYAIDVEAMVLFELCIVGTPVDATRISLSTLLNHLHQTDGKLSEEDEERDEEHTEDEDEGLMEKEDAEDKEKDELTKDEELTEDDEDEDDEPHGKSTGPLAAKKLDRDWYERITGIAELKKNGYPHYEAMKLDTGDWLRQEHKEELWRPAVCVDDREIFLITTRRVVVYHRDEATLRSFGRGIVVDPDGIAVYGTQVLVSDAKRFRLLEFDRDDGSWIKAWRTENLLPGSLTIDQRRLFVVDQSQQRLCAVFT